MFVGIDVGGTNLKAGLVDQEGHLLAAARRPVSGFTGAEDFATDLTELVLQAAKEGGVGVEALESVGIGLPGAVDGGDVLFTTNIPMENVPLAKLFRQRLDVPVYLGNDADCAAVGEFFGGAGRGCRDFVVVTLGTGIGAGIILDGKLRGGLASSEAGHMVIQQGGEPCNCGRRGCWERYASATALIQQTRAAMEAHPESGLYQAAEALGTVDGRTAFQAALAGDLAHFFQNSAADSGNDQTGGHIGDQCGNKHAGERQCSYDTSGAVAHLNEQGIGQTGSKVCFGNSS